MFILFYSTFNSSCTAQSFMQFYSESWSLCFYLWESIYTSYYLARFCIWYYNIVRLKFIFKSAPILQYHSKFLYSLCVAFILLTVSLITFCTGTAYAFDLIKYNIYCIFQAPLWFAATVGLFDSILSVICYWLFYRRLNPLAQMIKNHKIMKHDNNRKQSTDGEYNHDLMYILRKYAILSGCTMISTWIVCGVGSFTQSPCGLFGLDSIVNVWCVMLYDIQFDHIYNLLCGCISKSHWKSDSLRNDTGNKVKDDTNIQSGPQVRSGTTLPEMELSI